MAIAAALVLVAFALGFVIGSRGPGGLAVESYSDADLQALVPVGWKDESRTAPFGTALAGWLDLGDPSASETVQATLPAGPQPSARAHARMQRLSRLSGYVQDFLGTISLGGGRSASVLQYELGGVYTAQVYFDACTPAIGMTVTLDAPSGGALRSEEDTLPQGAEPVCDGPAFTSPDRADLALPLHLPS